MPAGGGQNKYFLYVDDCLHRFRLFWTAERKTRLSCLRKADSKTIPQEPLKHLPTLFTTLRDRYLNRPGGYTRVLRIEPLNNNNDQAPSAILELVDGPRDMRFAMTAKTLVRERQSETGGIREITARNVAKVTRFREGGEEELEKTVRRLETAEGLKGGEEEREEWESWPNVRDERRKEEGERRKGASWQEKRDKRGKRRDPNTGRRNMR